MRNKGVNEQNGAKKVTRLLAILRGTQRNYPVISIFSSFRLIGVLILDWEVLRTCVTSSWQPASYNNTPHKFTRWLLTLCLGGQHQAFGSHSPFRRVFDNDNTCMGHSFRGFNSILTILSSVILGKCCLIVVPPPLSRL